jgi:hypothetical protein
MMLRKMSFWALGLFTLAFIYLLTDTAEARRMGGGRSFGSSPSYQRSAPSPQRSKQPLRLRHLLSADLVACWVGSSWGGSWGPCSLAG